MLEQLKEEVYQANLALVKHQLVVFTWGNVSGYDEESGLVAIKPSGVSYDDMKASDIVIVNLEGEVVEGHYKPSSDTQTHLEIYKAFKGVKGVVHTHSEWATSFAQSGQGILPYGTTHADYFYGEIPCTRLMTDEEVKTDYEKNTGKVIVETFKAIQPLEVPGVLVNEHGPFTWGTSPSEAVYHAVVLEEIAKMAYKTMMLKDFHAVKVMEDNLLNKHYLRKHGKNAYYGQS